MGLKLVGEVALDGSGFERGLNQIGSAANSLKHMLLAAFGGWTIESAIAKTVENARELANTSKRLGVGVEQLQLLRQAAKDGGSDIEGLTKQFEKLDEARAKALSGSKEGQIKMAAFGRLGISESDLRTKSAAELFMGPLRQSAQRMNPEDLGPVLKQVLGKAFGEAIPVLTQDFDALKKKMEEMGAIMSAETIAGLKALEDEFSLLSQIIVSQLGPALLKLAEACYEGILRMGKGLAGASGAAGAGTAKMSLPRAGLALGEASLIGMSGLFQQYAMGKSEKEVEGWIKSKMAGAGFDVKAMQGGKAAAEAPWEAQIKQFSAFLAKIKEDAEKLKHPPKPTFSGADGDEKVPKVKTNKERGDSLTRVGNFLGSSRDVLADLALRQVDLLKQIVENTKPSQTTGDSTSFPLV